MTIELPEKLPFSVDSWSPSSNKKRHHFLTHAHKDHSQGITTFASYPIYCTLITKSLVLLHYPQLDESLFVSIEVGQTLVVGDPDGDFSVTAFDANHCPGAVMFLFEGSFGNYLHTGDCRLTLHCLQSLPDKYIGRKGQAPRCQLDCIFLDCTFGKFTQAMPTKQSAIQQVINCIWKHPNASVVYLACDLLGQEEVLVNVSKTFGSKIYVDNERSMECSQTLSLIVPEILSSDQSSRFHLFDGSPGVYERAQAKILEARSNLQQEPLVVRASTQWYAHDEGVSDTQKRMKERCDQAVRDLFGVWHVCYSIHSSREELELALQLLAPKWVVSTTPTCRATELKYVKKNCKLTPDNSFWKLLDINTDEYSRSCELVEGLSCSTLEETDAGSTVECQIEPIRKPISPEKLMNLSPQSKKPCLTLFGRARHGLQDSTFMKEDEMVCTDSDFTSQVSTESGSYSMPIKEADKGEEPESLVGFESIVVTETKNKSSESSLLEETACEGSESTLMAASNKADYYHAQTKEVVEVESRSLKEDQDNASTEFNCELKEVEIKKQPYNSLVGSSSYTESMRKFYRSMHVSVPRPLPSLVELMNSSKCAKRRF